jgi:hypothetical protein
MFQAAQNLGTGFKLYFMIDSQAYGSAGQTAAGTMMAAYYNHPNYWHYAGKPVMSGYSGNISGTSGSADNTFWSGVLTAVSGQGVTPFFWPNFTGLTVVYNDEPTSLTNTTAWFNPWINGVSSGIQAWNSLLPDPIYPTNWTYAALANANKIPCMANINAWLSQIRYYWQAYNGGTSETVVEYLEGNGYEGMSNQWTDIIKYARTNYVCLNTWNDFTESHMCPATAAQVKTTATNWSNFTIWTGGTGSSTCTVIDNAATDPDGNQHAGSWARTTTSAAYQGLVVFVAASALSYTFTVKAKANTATNFAMRIQGTFPHRADVVFNLSSGTISSAAAPTSTFTSASASITSLGSGWYTCSLTATSGTDALLHNYFSFNSNNVRVDGTDSSATSSGWVYNATLSQGANAIDGGFWGVGYDYVFCHVGFAQLNKYFIQWFKTGAQPAWPDSVYVAYRNAPMSVTPSLAPGSPVPAWNQQSHNATLDDIYVTTILTAPADVVVSSGGVPASCAASVLPSVASANAGQSNGITAGSTIAVAANGSVVQQDLATTVVGLNVISAIGAAIFSRSAVATGGISFDGAGALGQSDPASSIFVWDLNCESLVGVSQLATASATLPFGGSAAVFLGSGTPAYGFGIIPSLFANGQIRTFAHGVSREVFFEGDGRRVYWPPWGGDIAPLFNIDATKPANRVVSWS